MAILEDRVTRWEQQQTDVLTEIYNIYTACSMTCPVAQQNTTPIASKVY